MIHRVGLIADTHIPEAGDDLPPSAYAAFADCELVLHCGDLHTLEVVDRLERIAPTLVSRGNGDSLRPRAHRPGVPEDRRVADRHVVRVGAFSIGLTHDLGHAEGRADDEVRRLLHRRFGEPVDIAVSGHSHVPSVWGLGDGTTLVNPGSPTMPYGYPRVLGTVVLLHIDEAEFELTVLDLATGQPQLELRGPGPHPFQAGPRPRRPG